MSYSTVYKNINSKTVEVSKELASKIWKSDLTLEEKIEFCKEWLKKVSEIYNCELPKFIFDKSQVMYNQTGGGCYKPSTNEITLYKKLSFTTLLHEFRHCMQHQLNVKMYRNDMEEDARAWSVSLFKSSAPKAYENAVRKRILHFN